MFTWGSLHSGKLRPRPHRDKVAYGCTVLSHVSSLWRCGGAGIGQYGQLVVDSLVDQLGIRTDVTGRDVCYGEPQNQLNFDDI